VAAVPIGTAIRHRLGPLEPIVSESYRRRFINLDDLVRTIVSIADPRRIVEVGCGDGAVAQRLCEAFDQATYVGLDIAPNPGRLFDGDRGRAEFRSELSSELVARAPEPFDLVMLVDVFHHLTGPQRIPTVRDLDHLCAPGGVIVIKDWARSASVGHLACYVSDRYVSGDETVRYASRTELLDTIAEAIPDARLICEPRVPPRRNNILFALRKP
jgi:2-polyprenyl-3-methyl-5-hydroxy-6-metoxy-1,4-benzoquinol methylase